MIQKIENQFYTNKIQDQNKHRIILNNISKQILQAFQV
jgi:hypothetical protein